jgi:ribonucleoside-diphosphate reductase beta chain
MGVYTVAKKSHLERNMFFDDSVDIARYDEVKYLGYEKLTDKMLGMFWRPDEIDVTKDRAEFRDLSEHEQHIFTSNLKRQILLDSVQGRSPNLALLPICSLPELEVMIETWAFFETIHSRSYTHIIRNIYPNPSIVFDEINSISEILDCADDVSKYYDDLIRLNNEASVGNVVFPYEHKKALWLCLHSIYILEGIRFYVSFACSWAFAELKKMEGNAKIIKLICRDENLHLSASTQVIRNLLKEDPDFVRIQKDCTDEVTSMFLDAINQEKEWVDFLFKDGSMIGLNGIILKEYVEWIGTKRMKTLGYMSPFQVSQANPLPWTEKWISGAQVQVAPQEVEISSYIVGGVKQDVTDDTLKGLSL